MQPVLHLSTVENYQEGICLQESLSCEISLERMLGDMFSV
jgi:hypothetical protein